MRIRHVLPCAIALMCACSATNKLDRPRRATNVRDAGSVHFTVLSVAPWHHYVTALQPNFQLAADDALGIVVMDSRRGEESALDALSMSASLSHDGGDPTASPAAAPPSVDVSTFKAGGPLGLDRSGGGDAMMRYAAATSLYQEVQLLNRYVRDAAIPTGFRPYVVRLQISLMPRRRHQPYDTYSTLSFFTNPGATATSDSGLSDPTAPKGRGAEVQVPGTTLRGGDDLLQADQDLQAPRVLPLLVSDNLESSLESKSSQVIRALKLSLTGLWDQSGANLGSSGVRSGSTDDVVGRDLNSLLTVARVSENTLRVRLGAVQAATTDYAMVPRNHNITLLLMVPEAAGAVIRVVGKTELVDTTDGTELGGTSAKQIRNMYRKIQSDYAIDGLKQEVLEQLLDDAQRNDQQAFARRLRAATGDMDDSLGQSLWIDLVSLMAGSQYTASRFELPGHGASNVETTDVFYQQTAVVLDDNRLNSVIVLRGARFSDMAEVGAVLDVNHEGRDISLPAESIVLDGPTREVRLTFPSLNLLGLGETASAPGGVRLTLDMDGDMVDFDALYLRRVQ
ncbi:MAG: hypothetical protein ACI8QZ_001306 [Chlamydiales bacterium]|jgi:hypothetical protein